MRAVTSAAVLLGGMAIACGSSPAQVGVYVSGPNAAVPQSLTGEVKLWGPDGTVTRTATPGPGGTTLLGQAGPLWRFNHDVPAPPHQPTVPAALVERAGIRMKAVLGTSGTPSVDAARPGGVYVRSIIKTRQPHAPPLFVVSATGDDVGAGRYGGPADVRSGNNCKAALASVDAAADRVLSSHVLEDAERVCAVPRLLGPVDIDGDGAQHFLVYGDEKDAGFRAWFTLLPDGSLVAGPNETWEHIPR